VRLKKKQHQNEATKQPQQKKRNNHQKDQFPNKTKKMEIKKNQKKFKYQGIAF
jgi:hypothetical protein